ncbi:efflux RND transporter permease subunit [bacterium]|nr:efflux RND transporter permease subunit [bacterium]
MIRASIGNPHAVFVGVMILVIFSVLAYMQIPVQLKPEVDPLEYRVRTSYPGASALEVEDQITNKLEKELAALSDLYLLTSDSNEGESRINLTFTEAANPQEILFNIISAVEGVRDLPEEAERPLISRSNAFGDVILWSGVLGGSDVNARFDTVNELVIPALLRVNGVGGAILSGAEERRIIVEPDVNAMAARGISLSELSRVLSLENRDARGGLLDEGERRFTVRTTGRFRNLDDVRNTVVRSGPSGDILLSDIARVLDGRDQSRSLVRINGQPALSLRIEKQSGANTVKAIEGVEEVFAHYNDLFEKQGRDIRIEILSSDKRYVEDGIHLVWHDLLIGALLASIVLALFLRAGRPILITVLSIPISLVSVFLVLLALDRSVNIIALAGLAFAVGLVVDDAIVALENIERHMTELKKPPKQAARDGVEEVWGAVLSITLVRIAVFIPIVLNTTEAGLLFKDIAIAIVASVLVSLLVTLSVVPSFAALLLRTESARKRLETTNPALHRTLSVIELMWLGEFVQHHYERFTVWACTSHSRMHDLGRLGLLAAVAILWLASFALLPAASYLPNGSQGFILCRAQALVGQRPDVTIEAFEPLVQAALADERVDSVFSIAGGFTAVGVRLHEEHSTPEDIAEVIGMLRKVGGGISGFNYIRPGQRSIFRIEDKQFTLEVTGPELETLSQISAELQRKLLERTDIVEPGQSAVRSSYVEGVPELRVQIDPHRARALGLYLADVASVVESMVAGRRVSTFTEAGREYDLEILGDPELISSRDRLGAILLQSPDGRLVRLDEIASISEGTGPTSVRHFNRERSISLTVNTRAELPTQTALELTENEVVAPLLETLPEGYTVSFGEAADKLRTTFQSLIFQGILAVVIIYLLLVALFRSFYYPFVVLITIPLAWSGSFLAIALAYRLTDGVVQFDVLGMLGLIIMSGIVAANAILIIAQMLNFQQEGLGPNEALQKSSASRLRPIMMTVLAAVFGMAPLALGQGSGSELYRGLGIVVVGGLISSTIFTLLVVPTLMSLVNDLQAKLRKGGV